MESSSSSSSTSNSNGPRPLATKPEYVRRSHTSKSGLLSSSTTPSTAPSNIKTSHHELDHFFFKRPVNDSLLQPNAKRARKLYRSILRDQYYLLDLKQMWQTKLKKLQMEQMLLEQMCTYTQEDVNDTPPLFSHNDSTSLSIQQQQQQQEQEQQQQQQQKTQRQRQFQRQQRQLPFLQGQHRHEMRQPEAQQQDQHDDSHSLDLWTPASSTQPESIPSSPHSSVYITADDVNSDTNSVTDSFYLPVSRSGRMTPRKSPIPTVAATTTTQTTMMGGNASHLRLEEYVDNDNNDDSDTNKDLLDLADSGNDSNGDDNVEEEDEETARRALTFMLAHYGNDL